MSNHEKIEQIRALLSQWAHVERKDAMHEGCARLLAIVDEMKRDRDELANKLQRITDPPIKRLSLEDGAITMDLDAPELARIMATTFWDTLTENKADNYVELSFAKPETPLKRVVVNVRKIYGRTPDELRQQAVEERDRERARADKAEAALAYMRDGKSPIHECPPNGSGLTSCCGRTPFELSFSDRLTADPALVNCDRVRLRDRAIAAESALAAAREKVKGLDVVTGDRYEPHGNLVDRAEVLAALGIDP